MPAWSDYQEEVADFFRSLGLSAQTNERITGVRTTHDVDVVVRSKHAGFDVLWLVECKSWKTPIPKEKVLVLRSIVDDTGADRGFLMAESGYQSGALEAARFANVMLTSIVDLKETLAYEVGMAKLRSILDRVELCRDRYWAMEKDDRIELGLRPDVFTLGYMGDAVIRAVEHTARHAFHYGFPVVYDRTIASLSSYGGSSRRDLVARSEDGACDGPSELYETLNRELIELEGRLDAAEAVLRQRMSPSDTP